MRLDKEDIQQSNLNSKYLGVTIVVKYPDSFICFFVFTRLTRKVRFDTRSTV